VSLRPVEDPDPLLEFSDEPVVADSSAPPLEPAVQPVVATEDRPPIQQPPAHNPTLVTRVERLERALSESKSQVTALKADVATLIRTVADIRKQPSAASIPLIPTKLSNARVAIGRAPQVAGLIVGAALGIGGWMYLSSDTDVSMAAPASDARGTVIGGLAPTAPSDTGGLAPTAAPAPESNSGGQPANVAAAPASYAAGLAPNVASSAESNDRGQPPNATPAAKSNVRGQPPKVAATAARSERGQPAEVVRAAKYVGTLAIDAEPGGDVFIDREPAGRTPVRLSNLRAGSHLVWISRDGYRRWTRVVQVPADRVTTLSAELEPLAR
jgi:hypothetical protein